MVKNYYKRAFIKFWWRLKIKLYSKHQIYDEGSKLNYIPTSKFDEGTKLNYFPKAVNESISPPQVLFPSSKNPYSPKVNSIIKGTVPTVFLIVP